MSIYKDLDLSFNTHPVTGDVSRKNDLQSITQSLKTLLLSSQGEIINQPQIGAGINELLHAPKNQLTQLNVSEKVRETINNFEPRVELETVKVDMISNGFLVNITFFMDTITAPVDISIPLVKI